MACFEKSITPALYPESQPSNQYFVHLRLKKFKLYFLQEQRDSNAWYLSLNIVLN